MFTSGDLRTWIPQNIIPTILAKASPSLTQQTLEQLLTPYSILSRVSIRTPSKSYTLGNAPLKIDESGLKKLVSEHPPNESVDYWIQRGPRDEADAKTVLELNNLPWFQAFRRSLFRMEGSLETGDTLTQPLCVALAALSTEPNLVATLRSMISQHAIADIPRLFVVVGDGPLPQELAVPDLTPLILLSPSNPQPGVTLLLQTVLDQTEKRIFAFNQVAAKMKGLRNAFKTWFGKPDSSSSSSGNASAGNQDAVKVRLLADLLFLLRDYETAVSTYVVVRDDYLASDLHLKVGSAFEMMALASYMNRETGRILEYTERAMDSYFKAKSLFPQLYSRIMTRCSLILVDFKLEPKDRPVALRCILRAGSVETEFGAALLSEQAAFLFLNSSLMRPKGGLVRKFVFQMANAGSMYRSCGLERHAIRAFASVVNMFKGRGWPAAEQHVDLQIGSLALLIKDDVIAQRFRGYVLERGIFGLAVKSHHIVLKDWLECTQRLQSKSLIVSIPNVLDKDSKLMFLTSQLSSSVNNSAEEEKEEVSKAVAAFKAVGGTGRLPKPFPLTAFAGEKLCVNVTLFNPLLSVLPMKNLRLLLQSGCCECEPLEGLDLDLNAGETRLIMLFVTPKQPGKTLVVEGLEWQVYDLETRLIHRFERKGLYLNDTRQQSVQKARAADLSLTAEVGSQAPFLRLQCEALDVSAGPEPIGAEFNFKLKLCNAGLIACTDLIASYISGQGLEWKHVKNGREKPGNNKEEDIIDGNLTRLGIDKLEPQEETELHLKLCASTTSPLIVIRYNNRFAKLQLPVPVGPMVKGFARVYNKNMLVVTLEDDSQTIRPLSVSCFSCKWKINQLVAPRTEPWQGSSSLIFGLQQVDQPTSSRVDLVKKQPYDQSEHPFLPTDPFLRSAHAKIIEESRALAKAAYEARRAELDALGQLPITIQDIRRMKQQGVQLTVMNDGKPGPNDPPTGSVEAILQAKEFVHLKVQWESSSKRLGCTYIPRVPIPEAPKVSISILHVSQVELISPHAVAKCKVIIKIKDESGLGLRKAFLDANSRHNNNSIPEFKKQTFWLGKRKQVLKDVEPFGSVEVHVEACFKSLGVFSLGPITVKTQEGEEFFSNVGYIVVTKGAEVMKEDDTMLLAKEEDNGDLDDVLAYVSKSEATATPASTDLLTSLDMDDNATAVSVQNNDLENMDDESFVKKLEDELLKM